MGHLRSSSHVIFTHIFADCSITLFLPVQSVLHLLDVIKFDLGFPLLLPLPTRLPEPPSFMMSSPRKLNFNISSCCSPGRKCCTTSGLEDGWIKEMNITFFYLYLFIFVIHSGDCPSFLHCVGLFWSLKEGPYFLLGQLILYNYTTCNGFSRFRTYNLVHMIHDCAIKWINLIRMTQNIEISMSMLYFRCNINELVHTKFIWLAMQYPIAVGTLQK